MVTRLFTFIRDRLKPGAKTGKSEQTRPVENKPDATTRPHRKKRRRPRKKKAPQVKQAAVLQADHKKWDPESFKVTPEEGMFVFFPADMLHEVTINNSPEMRLSLGINIGPVDYPD